MFEQSYSQFRVKDDTLGGFFIPINFSASVPSQQLAERFGHSYRTGTGCFYRTFSGWTFGVEADFWFGDRVLTRDQILKSVSNEQGLVLDHMGLDANLMTFQRGWIASFYTGNLIRVLNHNPNSGILITAGGGFLQHRIRLESGHQQSIIYQIENEYQRGYDRLNVGWQGRVFIGYLHAGNYQTYNFIVGIEHLYGRTSSVRGFDYATGLPDEGVMTNGLTSLKVSWFFSMYRERVTKEKKYFYY
ncbi:hypothetical protein JCM31826_19450 [Thermaurantimonas aggregans]|uniref:Outer membrane protein beta-barrel domain-containing protein n=1 Tax=Thermaurantimonas aggregans TaxID=2173829 RepID=A0A401XNB5_9FLAO|nr:hypothetical protein JCM31826_19450 [Thermaurantimonas aggregans]